MEVDDIAKPKKAKLSIQLFADNTLVAISDDPVLWNSALGAVIHKHSGGPLPVGSSTSPTLRQTSNQAAKPFIDARSRRLTIEQRQAVLDMLSHGLRDAEIARAVGITASAIRTYKRNPKAMTKTGSNSDGAPIGAQSTVPDIVTKSATV